MLTGAIIVALVLVCAGQAVALSRLARQMRRTNAQLQRALHERDMLQYHLDLVHGPAPAAAVDSADVIPFPTSRARAIDEMRERGL